MEDKIIEIASSQGFWAVSSVMMVLYIKKNQEKRDHRQEEREKNYLNIIFSLADRLEIVENIKDEVKQIKELLNK